MDFIPYCHTIAQKETKTKMNFDDEKNRAQKEKSQDYIIAEVVIVLYG
jgi:hypothetical protein